ncbi:MAG TPA: VOC family protein [Acidimicrobiales bacterium]|nr:VOC family protein [Acidimicrobiales bacterium]
MTAGMEGGQRVTPHLHYDDVGAALAWLRRVFGLVEQARFERDGGNLTARLAGPDGGVVMISGVDDEFRAWMAERAPRFEQPPGPAWPLLTHAVTVLVDDVDAHHARAVGEGAVALGAPKDQPWGLRSYAALDPEGHQWEFATVRGRAPASRGPIVTRVQTNRSIPPTTVIPVLVYPDVREAVAWLSGAFGFVERTRIGEDHRAQLSVGADGAMIVADARGEQQPPHAGIVNQVVKVRVGDVEAQYERARDYGARVLEPPTEQMYGERECTVEDLAGHRWQFTQTLRDVAPEEYGCQTVAPWPDR